ncbi:hypothetical protein [Marinobacter profundi]|uniref:Lipoprotein n=1 Tax=Marinobacter profundi TaxID=2666256 RepID=A0A2G1UMP7_9GAMM|nr:hypothetical protein [Marinobacter profundi]PHQ15733.1 hypothetical protein CLH61_06155 [Marinobacter profundi]
MKIRPIIILFATFSSGCISTPTTEEIPVVTDGYHGITLLDLEATVLIDSRFTERQKLENRKGKFWVYTDYEGESDQEFILLTIGSNDLPEQLEGATDVDTPLGPAFELFFATELSQLSLDKLSEAHGFDAPACGYGRQLIFRPEKSGRYLSITYIEGKSCSTAFQLDGDMEKLTQTLVRTRAETVVKLKPL